MAINPQKFLSTTSTTVKASTKIIGTKSFSVMLSKKSIKDIGVIKVKLIEIDSLLKGTLAAEKKKLDQKKRQESSQRREKQEEKLETKPQAEKGPIKTPTLPKMGFLAWVKNFIGNVILGYFAVRLVKFLPLAVPIVKFLGKATDFVIDFGGKLLDGLTTFIDWGYKAYDATRGFMKNMFGENQAKEFDRLSNALNQFLNLALIVGMATAAGGGFGKPRGSGGGPRKGPGGKPEVTRGRGGQKPTGKPRITGDTGPKWWTKITSKLKGGPFAKLAGPLSKFAGAAIPFAGAAFGALDAKARFSRGEQLGGWMASISSALDAFAGSVAAAGLIAGATGIGIPAFAVLEAIAGVSTAVSIGIDAILLVSDIIKAFGGPTVPGMAGGGRAPATRGGRAQGGVRRTIGGKKGKYKRTIPEKPGKVEITSPGADVGGKDKLFGIFPNPLAAAQKVVDAINPFKTVKDAGEELGKTDYFGPILAISSKITAGQKPSQQDYQNVGRGLNLLIAKGIQDKQLKGGIVAAFAEGGMVDADVLSAAETGGDISNWVAKTFQGEIESNAQKTLRMIRENAEKKAMKEKETTPGADAEGVDGFEVGPAGSSGDKLTMARNLMRDLKLTPAQAAGIVGNMAAESGVENARPQGSRPGTKAPLKVDGVTGYGLVQWTSRGRQQALADFAKSRGADLSKPLSMNIEYQFFLKEFQGAYANVLKQIRQAQDVKDASTIFMQQYEIPAGYKTESKIMERYNMSKPIYDRLAMGEGKATEGVGTYIGSPSIGLGKGYGSEGSKIAGELGRFLKKKGVVPGSIHRHPEHPPFSLSSGHSKDSYHYQGRAIDLGGYTREQGPILAAIAEFNRMKGVKPVQLLHGGNEPRNHSDHVHVAYARGGETLGYPHLATLGEEGKEVVVDADSAGPAKNMLLAINQAKGYKGVMQAIQQYAPYDALAPQTIIMQSQQVPSGDYDSGSESGGGMLAMFGGAEESNSFDALYIGG